MMTKELSMQMHIYRKRDRKYSLVLRREGYCRRLNLLLNVYYFVAEMVQLARAIATGASQHTRYLLNSERGVQWVMEVLFSSGVLRLDCWALLADRASTIRVFDWVGDGLQFQEIVQRMEHGMKRQSF